MAKCVRKNCNRLVSPLPEAKRKRLCKKHYLRFCELSERKEKDLVYRINKYIPRKIKRLKKGRIYYCAFNSRRGYVRKKSSIENAGLIRQAREKLVLIRKTPAWRNTESYVRRIRIGPDLPVSLNEVTELYSIYSWINFCKNSKLYAINYLGGGEGNLKLQLYKLPSPSKIGDSSHQQNIITPITLKNKVINQLAKNRNSRGTTNVKKPLSLYKSLIELEDERVVALKLLQLTIETSVHPHQYSNNLPYLSPGDVPPLFGLLLNELKRLNVVGVNDSMLKLAKKYKNESFTLELIAIHVIFNMARNGTPEVYSFLSSKFDKNGHLYRSVMIIFMMLELDLDSYSELLELYNSFFSTDVIKIKDNILLWASGKKETLPFEYQPGI
ncbi:TPA: hypothetical protein ACWMBS_004356 [Klebsiella pneumoniae]|uniref:hypothetical protein n=1 Tax=Klebsiella pneumoniae TaxID=573 RepID=UPI000AD135D3|nr:hypothetical protein [Klebsiella pneumoniae]EIV7913752.1 hypothetical protein [Klebsiella pneumoniae]EIV7918873.1 hypothetical protein [Klebsiella pneumoniae]EKU8804232.1 hypothetical protein [Klebsiella pneumoniae]EKU8805344.1 hypothetical protein [Klebsiella pneumoniae]EKX1863359.1 hypothetical protein [Klebsiella pneumoniae]